MSKQEFEYLYARDALAARVIQAWVDQVAIRCSVAIEEERVEVLRHIEAVLLARYRDGIEAWTISPRLRAER